MTRDEAPFRPRRRWSAVLRGLRARPSTSARPVGMLAYVAIAGTLFCFWRVFVAFGGMAPWTGAPLDNARAPLVWFMLGAACAAAIPFGMDHRVEPKASLRPGALREMARETWAALGAWVQQKRKGARAALGPEGDAENLPPQGR